MPSTLILDMADPDVAEMVSQWQQGGRYSLTLDVTQQTPSEGKVSFTVDGISDYGDAGEEVPAEMGEHEMMGEEMGPEMGPVMDLVGRKRSGVAKKA